MKKKKQVILETRFHTPKNTGMVNMIVSVKMTQINKKATVLFAKVGSPNLSKF
jgi:hypothetical protein